MSNDTSGAPGIVTHPNEPNVSSADAKPGAASSAAVARLASKPFLIVNLPLCHLTQAIHSRQKIMLAQSLETVQRIFPHLPQCLRRSKQCSRRPFIGEIGL